MDCQATKIDYPSAFRFKQPNRPVPTTSVSVPLSRHKARPAVPATQPSTLHRQANSVPFSRGVCRIFQGCPLRQRQRLLSETAYICSSQCSPIDIASAQCTDDACFCATVVQYAAACSQSWATINANVFSTLLYGCQTELHPTTSDLGGPTVIIPVSTLGMRRL